MASHQVEKLRKSFLSGKSKSISWRRDQLKAFIKMLDENKDEFCCALWEDLHKNPSEAELMEVAQIRNEVVLMLERLNDLSCQTKCKQSKTFPLNDSRIIKEPLGVVLTISPWNYPVMLALQPLAGAIAAGNCVMLKPSEISQASTQLIQELIPRYLDHDCFAVYVGGPKESHDLLLNNRFDLIMYTGGITVAKIIMQAAAAHLTPVIFELGGKNPCYVDDSCDIESAARCLTWGKWTNAGQICVSPDYVLCKKQSKELLISALKKSIAEFYGEDPQQSSCYGRIISQQYVGRLKSLLEGVDIVYGGVVDENDRYFSPTLVTNIKSDAPILHEEIFGPILPIITIENVDEAIKFINSKEKSLQLSIFAKDRLVIKKIVSETFSGGVTVNDLLMQIPELDLPFGGVGQSGMGCYHGNYSFNSFSHRRRYLESKTPEVALANRYPPFTASATKSFMFKSLSLKKSKSSNTFCLLALLGLCFMYLYNAFMAR